MVKSEWFRTFSLEESNLQSQTILQSWDTANKPSELSDFRCSRTMWGIIGKHLYLLHVYRKRVDYPDTEACRARAGRRFSGQSHID